MSRTAISLMLPIGIRIVMHCMRNITLGEAFDDFEMEVICIS
jgi:hypothetical protein